MPPRAQRPRQPRQQQQEAAVIAEVATRTAAETEVIPPAGNSSVLDALNAVVKNITSGGDLTAHRSNIERLVCSQEQRATMIDNLLLTHDYERLVEFVKTRQKLENFLLGCANRDDLSPAESLAFLRYVGDESKYLTGRIKAGSSSINDIVSLMSKIDYTIQVDEGNLMKRLANTSPQGREIIRRVAFKLAKTANAQPTRTDVND